MIKNLNIELLFTLAFNLRSIIHPSRSYSDKFTPGAVDNFDSPCNRVSFGNRSITGGTV